MKLRPTTIQDAKQYIDLHHRHSRAPVSGLCAVGVEEDGELVGVGILGRPVSRLLQNGRTAEITRVCTLGKRNAPSMLYGALCRAAKALGYHRVYTYTLEAESGSSLRAAGFRRDAAVEPRASWDRPKRRRVQTDLFGRETRDPGPKVRWVRDLSTNIL